MLVVRSYGSVVWWDVMMNLARYHGCSLPYVVQVTEVLHASLLYVRDEVLFWFLVSSEETLACQIDFLPASRHRKHYSLWWNRYLFLVGVWCICSFLVWRAVYWLKLQQTVLQDDQHFMSGEGTLFFCYFYGILFSIICIKLSIMYKLLLHTSEVGLKPNCTHCDNSVTNCIVIFQLLFRVCYLKYILVFQLSCFMLRVYAPCVCAPRLCSVRLCSASMLRAFVLRFPGSMLRVPCSAFRVPYSVLHVSLSFCAELCVLRWVSLRFLRDVMRFIAFLCNVVRLRCVELCFCAALRFYDAFLRCVVFLHSVVCFALRRVAFWCTVVRFCAALRCFDAAFLPRAQPRFKSCGGSESGEARIEGAKRPRIEGKARIEGEARERAGEESGEGARWAPPQKIFGISNFKSFNLVYTWIRKLDIIDFSKKT